MWKCHKCGKPVYFGKFSNHQTFIVLVFYLKFSSLLNRAGYSVEFILDFCALFFLRPFLQEGSLSCQFIYLLFVLLFIF